MGRPSSRVCRVLMTSPLAPFADVYPAELREHGYTPLTVVNELRQVGRLSCWLEVGGLSVADLSGERVDEFLVWQCWRASTLGGRGRSGLRVGVLRGLGVVAVEEPAVAGSPVDLLLGSLERYPLVERGLAAGTVSGMWRAIEDGQIYVLGGLTSGEAKTLNTVHAYNRERHKVCVRRDRKR